MPPRRYPPSVSSPLPSTPAGPARARVGGYELVVRIGEGGMGVVHLARRDDGERVALKVLRPHVVGDEEARRRLAREVGSLSRVRSRWVAEIVDADPWADVPFVATRYVPGLSLHDHVVEEGPVLGRDLTWFAGCLAEGLSAVHGAGVLHRDVKPSNVLMEGRTPILIDFGLARVAEDPRLTQTGWLLGTPGYLAPEVLHGDEPSPAADVHAWAATVAYAATGSPPFGRGPAMAIMDRVRRGQHDLDRHDLDEPFRSVLLAALDPDPHRRPSLDDLLAWLRPFSTRPHDRRVPPPLGPSGDGGTRVLAVEPPQPELPELPELPEDDWQDRPDEDEVWEPWHPPRAGAAERGRRALLTLLAGTAAAAGVAAYPWFGALALVVLVWLLRSGSMARSGMVDRRLRRGRATWWEGPALVVGTPVHLLRGLPGTLLLAVVAGGVAVTAGLVALAVWRDASWALAAAGAGLVLAGWWGPGGSRVRAPVSAAVLPVARQAPAWLAGAAVLVAVAAGLATAAADGPDWAPVGAPSPVDPIGEAQR